ncbi:MAG: metal-dependent hydrolase, partial [Oscillospiraceae bacterium]|nr:metal-dependent hydrolase [Oscillospiraceae bacterium]
PQFPRWTPCIVSFAVGAGTHVGLDALNPAGVPLFWPWKKRVSLASIDTGRRAEALLRRLMLLAIPLCVVAFWAAPQLLHIR